MKPEPDEPKYKFNDGKIVTAVAKAMGFSNQEASQTVFEAHQKGRLPDTLTITQAKQFCDELIKS